MGRPRLPDDVPSMPVATVTLALLASVFTYLASGSLGMAAANAGLVVGAVALALRTLQRDFERPGVVGGRFVLARLPLYAKLIEGVRQMANGRSEALVGLSRLLVTDPVSALPNRLEFRRRLDAHAGRSGTLLFLDLDRFKTVNDTFGHAAGDELLANVAKRLELATSVVPGAVVARLGGDEFGILLPDGDLGAAKRVAQRVISVISEPIEITRGPVDVGCSIGIVSVGPDSGGTEALLSAADAAMYEAKARGRGTFFVYDERLRARLREQQALESDLRRALAAHEFTLYYQPQIDAASNAVVGAEALVRWLHPTRGLVQPGTFIGAAERSHQILEVGGWVLRAAVLQAARWRAEGRNLRISINVSAVQFARSDFVDDVRAALDVAGAQPEWLELELTETLSTCGDNEILRRIGTLREMGIRVAVDDFGTGYSNLALLKRLAVDRLKIDRSFVAGIENDEESRSVVMTILAMARTLDCEVVAEGVENRRQADILRAGGCQLLQGYLFSHPRALVDFEAWLGRWEAKGEVTPVSAPGGRHPL